MEQLQLVLILNGITSLENVWQYGRQNGPPKMFLSCEYVALPDKRDCADVMESKILTLGGYPALSRRAQCNHIGPYK